MSRADSSRLARITVDDETWAEFRRGLGQRYISTALGEMVRREVGRQSRSLNTPTSEQAAIAINDARSLIQELEFLVARLEVVAGDRNA